MPHLGPARNLSRLAVLRARHRFHVGRDQDGVADILAAMSLGRHAGRDRTLVGLLVDNAIQTMAQNVVAAYLLKLSPTAMEQLASGIAQLPPQNSFSQCMVSEAAFVPWLIDHVEATTSDAELLTACRRMVGDDLADELIEKSGGRDGIIEHTTALIPLYARLPGLVDRPIQHDDTPFLRLLDDANSNPVGALLYPALDKAWHAHRRYQCRNAMLRAALDITRRGKEVLSRHHDPTDGGNFEYIELDQGFELRSKLRQAPDSEKVVRLVVGQMPGAQPDATKRR